MIYKKYEDFLESISNINENSNEMTDDEIIQELKDCFLNVKDLIGESAYGLITKFQHGVFINKLNNGFDVFIRLKFDKKILGSGNEYAIISGKTIFNDNIINEIEDSVYLSCNVLNLEFRQSIVTFLSRNIYDHNSSINFYDEERLYNFLKEKKGNIREIHLYLKKK